MAIHNPQRAARGDAVLDHAQQRVDRQRERGGGEAAGSTSAQFCVCRPAKIRSPRLGWPTVVERVAAPIVHTAAVRMPAISTGSDQRRLDQPQFLPRRHAHAVRRLDHRGIDVRQGRSRRSAGSAAMRRATAPAAKAESPAQECRPRPGPRARAAPGRRAPATPSYGMVWTRLAKPSAIRPTIVLRAENIASGSATHQSEQRAPSQRQQQMLRQQLGHAGQRFRHKRLILRLQRLPAGRACARGTATRRVRHRAALAGRAASRGVASATIRPCSITSTRSASSSASAMSCVTRIVVRPIRSCSARIAAPSLIAGDGIERAEGLVHQQHAWPRRQRPRHADALALAAGKRIGHAPRPFRGETRPAPAARRTRLGRGPSRPPAAARSRYSRRRACAGTARTFWKT